MKINEIFKMIEKYNEVVKLLDLGEQKKIRYIMNDNYTGEIFETYKDFKKYLKVEILENVAQEILNLDLIQDIKYKDEFKGQTKEWIDKFGDIQLGETIKIIII